MFLMREVFLYYAQHGEGALALPVPGIRCMFFIILKGLFPILIVIDYILKVTALALCVLTR